MPTPLTRDAVLALIAEETRIEPAKLTENATLASLGIASLDVVTVLFAIEDRAGVEIQPEEVQGASTLGAFVGIVMGRLADA